MGRSVRSTRVKAGEAIPDVPARPWASIGMDRQVRLGTGAMAWRKGGGPGRHGRARTGESGLGRQLRPGMAWQARRELGGLVCERAVLVRRGAVEGDPTRRGLAGSVRPSAASASRSGVAGAVNLSSQLLAR